MQVSDVIRNGGGGPAAASVLRYYLSTVPRLSPSKRLLGSRPVPRLAARKLSSGGKALSVPVGVEPGSYYVVACADVAGRIVESNERNNCRAAAVEVVGAYRPNPQPVAATPEPGLAVSADIDTTGGTISGASAEGTPFSLTIPAGAIMGKETVTVTPLRTVDGGPVTSSVESAVQIEPDGMTLLAPATLTLGGVSGETVTSFAFLGATDLHLYPVRRQGSEISFDLTHFSSYGFGRANDSEVATQLHRVPNDREAWARQNLARTLAEAHQAAKGCTCDTSYEGELVEPAYGVMLYVWANEDILPLLRRAQTDETAAFPAITQLLSWQRTRTLAGLDSDGKLETLYRDMQALVPGAIKNASTRAFERCVQQHDPSQGSVMLNLARVAQLLDVDGDPALDEHLNKCLRFELDMTTVSTVHGVVRDEKDPNFRDPYTYRTEAQVLALPLEWAQRVSSKPVEVTNSKVVFDSGDTCTQFSYAPEYSFSAELEVEFRQPDTKGRPQNPFLTLGVFPGLVHETCADGPLKFQDLPAYNQAMGAAFGGPFDAAYHDYPRETRQTSE